VRNPYKYQLRTAARFSLYSRTTILRVEDSTLEFAEDPCTSKCSPVTTLSLGRV